MQEIMDKFDEHPENEADLLSWLLQK
jgi:hypothetical protein